MRLFGHPIHPLLIHFPTALLPMDLALSVLYHTTGNASFYQAGAYCLWAGSPLGLLAMLTGLFDLLVIPRTRKEAMTLGLYHGFVNGSLLIIFFVIAYKSWHQFPSPLLTGVAGLAVKGILVIALFVGNFLGGRLLYTHHVGLTTKQHTDGNLAV